SKQAAIHPRNSIGRAMRRIAHQIISDARRSLQDSSKSDAAIIHDFRRAMKRWRAFLRLLKFILGDESRRLRTEARDSARELARSRDAQSALDALSDLRDISSPRGRRTAAASDEMAALLKANRQRMETATLTPKLRARLMFALETASASVDHWPMKAMTFDEILTRLTADYRRARRAAPPDWTRAAPQALHKLRQRVVVHRYQMELLEPLWPRMGRAWIREAQRLRGQLGKIQDLDVLARFAAAGQPLAKWRSRLLPVLARRQADHTAAAKLCASRLFAETPKAFRRRFEALWKASDGKPSNG
ncbi:MAG TPA: CHAD domain-containing protein, partial [Candidatus Binataceae bacterium]|nr:CHAD domain-containing protein [Candidatus Binataceae bacterium]